MPIATRLAACAVLSLVPLAATAAELLGRAVLPAATFSSGPASGQFTTTANGISVPFSSGRTPRPSRNPPASCCWRARPAGWASAAPADSAPQSTSAEYTSVWNRRRCAARPTLGAAVISTATSSAFGSTQK